MLFSNKSNLSWHSVCLFVLLFWVIVSPVCSAQSSGAASSSALTSTTTGSTVVVENPHVGEKSSSPTKSTTDVRFDKSTWIPGVSYSPVLKTGIMAIHLRLFQKEEGTEKRLLSTKFGVATYFTSKSFGGGYGERLYLSKGQYRLDWHLGGGEQRSDFYGYETDPSSGELVWAEDPVDKKTKMISLAARYGKRVSKFAFAGVGMKASRSKHIGMDEAAKERLLENGYTEDPYDHRSMNVYYTYDSRSNPQNPSDGATVDLTASFFRESFGEDNDFEKYELKLAKYLSIEPESKRVLAWRASGNFSSSDTPQEMYPFYGSRGLQRGYVGKFYGKNLFHVEGELREKFNEKLGAVVFLGIGKAFGGGGFFDSLSDAEWLPNYGFGFRYKVIPERGLNARLDFGFGKDDEFTMYFGIGEAF